MQIGKWELLSHITPSYRGIGRPIVPGGSTSLRSQFVDALESLGQSAKRECAL